MIPCSLWVLLSLQLGNIVDRIGIILSFIILIFPLSSKKNLLGACVTFLSFTLETKTVNLKIEIDLRMNIEEEERGLSPWIWSNHFYFILTTNHFLCTLSGYIKNIRKYWRITYKFLPAYTTMVLIVIGIKYKKTIFNCLKEYHHAYVISWSFFAIR